MAPIRRYWSQPTSENREAIRKGLNLGGMRREYSSGIPNPEVIAPEGYTLDAALMARPGKNIRLDLLLDYANNLKLYPAFPEYFRNSQPPLARDMGQARSLFSPCRCGGLPARQPQGCGSAAGYLETDVEEVALAMKRFLAGVWGPNWE